MMCSANPAGLGLVLFLSLGGCAARAPLASAPTVLPRHFTVHIDHLNPSMVQSFTQARSEWVKLLRSSQTTDGRGLYIGIGDAGFVSLQPFGAYSDLDRRGAAVGRALGKVDKAAFDRYETASDSSVVPPHSSEIWVFEDTVSYRSADPFTTMSAAGYGRMVVEQLDPTPRGEPYEEIWKTILEALGRANYPLSRVTFTSVYGTGKLVSFWLAAKRDEYMRAPSVEEVVARSLGQERAAALFQRLQSTVLSTETQEAVPRPDLTSPPLDLLH